MNSATNENINFFSKYSPYYSLYYCYDELFFISYSKNEAKYNDVIKFISKVFYRCIQFEPMDLRNYTSFTSFNNNI